MTQDEFAVEALRKAPAAEAALSVLERLCTPKAMDNVYQRYRGRCYQNVLSLSTIVELVISAVLVHQGSGRKSFLSARKNGKLPATDQAVYGKLARTPAAVSQGLLEELVPAMKELLPDQVITDVPGCFNSFYVYGIDGKKIKDVAKRLVETRGTPGKLLGGKTLVALTIHERMVVAMNTHLDGEANDGPLVPGLLDRLEKLTSDKNILLLDSQFCDLTTPNRILARSWDFVIRYHSKTHFHGDLDPKATRTGTDSRGRAYAEQTGWLGKPGGKNSYRVRRIIVHRKNSKPISIVTSLMDWDKYSASDVLDLYALRWTIETVFQHVTKEFDLRHLIGSTAEATIFQFAISLLLYNVMVLIQQHVSVKKKLDPAQVSLPKIIRETKKQLIAVATLTSPRIIAEVVSARPKTDRKIEHLLCSCWDDDWKKAIKNNRRPKPPPEKNSGAHTSVFRRIQAYHCV